MMAHIQLPEGLPGIRGPMVLSPETTKPLCDLVQVLLTGPHTLTPAEREMIATYVSSQNDCVYCQSWEVRAARGSIFCAIAYLRQLWPRRFCGPIVGQNSRRGYGRAIFIEYPLGCHSRSVHA